MRCTPPDPLVAEAARTRLASLATPAGALGRLGEVAVWVAATQGRVPPEPLRDVHLVIFAGDHGVAAHGVSAYPASITADMVRTFVSGSATVNALAATHGVRVRVLDLGVDADLRELPARVTASKIRRGSGAIHLEDALTPEETDDALAVGAAAADEEIAAGAQLLLSGDMGIGNTTPAAALVAATLGLPAVEVVGCGTGVDDRTLAHKQELVARAVARAGARAQDPLAALTALGSADLAATTGYLQRAAERGVPVLLDGLMSVTCALLADRIAPGAAAWFAAGHRSTEPGQRIAMEKLGLEPILDLDLRLGEGSGAVAAVPILRSAVAVLRDVAVLADLPSVSSPASAREPT